VVATCFKLAFQIDALVGQPGRIAADAKGDRSSAGQFLQASATFEWSINAAHEP